MEKSEITIESSSIIVLTTVREGSISDLGYDCILDQLVITGRYVYGDQLGPSV